MKKCIFFLSVLVVLFGCKSTPPKSGAELMKDFAPHIDGVWVMTDYINDLSKTKSPLASANKLDGVVSMEITSSLLSNDTLAVHGSLNNHEGLDFHIVMKEGQNKTSLTTDITEADHKGGFYELGYEDKSLMLYHYNKDKKLLDKRAFTKVEGPLTEDSEPYGLQYMANRVLFAGKYDATDETGKQSEIEFTEDGMLHGVEGHTIYYVFTDFIGDPEGNLDEMCFDFQQKTQKPYIFEIKGDTTKLYAASENEERTQLIQGDLKYTLVKKH
ncbi:MAG: hypothetical protein JST82_01865 [Bacteroidetes bacterium]|nr:hypothetical protein [Bacteroidota bacterium]